MSDVGANRPTIRVIPITQAQKEVLDELMCDGPTDADIGERLGINARSAGERIWRLMHAAGYTTRTALVVALFRGKLRVRVEGARREGNAA